MFNNNAIIVLIAIYNLRDSNTITTYNHLQDFLPLEKSHISQSLSLNEEKSFIEKSEGNKYFTTILITPNGIMQAKRYINFLNNLLNNKNNILYF